MTGKVVQKARFSELLKTRIAEQIVFDEEPKDVAELAGQINHKYFPYREQEVTYAGYFLYETFLEAEEQIFNYNVKTILTERQRETAHYISFYLMLGKTKYFTDLTEKWWADYEEIVKLMCELPVGEERTGTLAEISDFPNCRRNYSYVFSRFTFDENCNRRFHNSMSAETNMEAARRFVQTVDGILDDSFLIKPNLEPDSVEAKRTLFYCFRFEIPEHYDRFVRAVETFYAEGNSK